MRRWIAALAMSIAVTAPLLSSIALAAEHTVVLHHMELDKIEGEMRVGDVVTFDNRSDMAHNLYITYSDGTVDNLDTQVPGVKRSLTLRVAGPTVIRCWIHPIIKSELVILDEEGDAGR
ncbi:methylamine utilization protein MauL [Hyphomicrobium nitrativorans]|nr:methylamine utilization protein MauL [Hyphomicrobium nitrativorans]